MLCGPESKLGSLSDDSDDTAIAATELLAIGTDASWAALVTSIEHKLAR